MRIFIFACFLFDSVGTGQTVALAHRHVREGNGTGKKDKPLQSAWTHFFKKNTVSSKHKRTIKVQGSAWQISVVMDKNAVSRKFLVNTFKDVCKGQRESGGWNVLSMSYQNDTMCFAGEGFESRARSAVIMIEMAVKILREKNTTISIFDNKTLNLGDVADCTFDFAYSLPWDAPEDCKTIIVPDFTFWAWPEAGLIPDYKTLTKRLHHIKQDVSPLKEVCGWAGNPYMNQQRSYFIQGAQNPNLFEIITPLEVTGTGGGRISMEDQARRWACMIDLPAAGFSGRVPMLLHTGRPLLSLERTRGGGGHYTDNVWYAQKMILGVHYVPVMHNLTNLEAAAQLALSESGKKIGDQAYEFAQNELTTEKAINGLAIALASLA